MKKNLSILLACFLLTGNLALAQDATISSDFAQSSDTKAQRLSFFNHLDVAVEAGSTGIGFDVATNLGNSLRLRAGFSAMPEFTLGMNFGVDVDEQLGRTAEEGTGESTFDKLSNMIEGMTGTKVSQNIEMLCKPNFYNFKLLLDIHPFQNKKWYFSPGVFIGSAKIGHAYNAPESMPTLYAANMYNTMYNNAMNDEPIIVMGSFELYPTEKLIEEMFSYGELGFKVGNRISDGSAYKMMPNEYCMVSADMKVNAVKPYLGFGYGGNALASSNKKLQFSFDCGLLFWGGVPSLVTHDGTDLVHDVTGIEGKMGQCVDLVKYLKVFPVINLRLTRTIF